MIKIIKILGVLSICLTLLTACESSSSSNIEIKKTSSKSAEHVSNDKTSNENSSHSSKEKKNRKVSDLKNPGKQLNLKIGDTANIKTTISHYLITLNSVKIRNDSINGYASQLDKFIIADITIKNIGIHNIKSQEAISNLIMTEDLKGGGYTDEAVQLGLPNAIKGTLKPGESKKGQAVFEAYNASKYYLASEPSDVAINVINNVKFTFKPSEAK